MQTFMIIWSFLTRYSILIILFLCQPVSLICWYRNRQQQARVRVLRRQGIRTNGIIKARYIGRFHWYLAFSYEDQGKEYLQRQSVFRTAYDKIQEGATVSVAYWPDDPQEAVLVNSEVWPLLRSLTILFSALSFAFVFLVIVGGFLLLVIP